MACSAQPGSDWSGGAWSPTDISDTRGNSQARTFEDNGGGAETDSSGKRRRSRWEPPSDQADSPNVLQQQHEGSAPKKRKSRWAAEEPPKTLFPNVSLPNFMNGIELDPEMQLLNIKLLELSKKLQSGQLYDEKADVPRSPSPEPIYDNMGIRINTREFRAREKLTKERHELIAQMIKRNPQFKPPPDYKPPKLQKKLYIPAKDYPGYNFIGLIIGPRGNTQKRMEKETGAKIVIRGKGSVKEGRTQQKRDVKPDPSENEDLHVLVEADTKEALEAAAGMVEKLLQPVEEGMNEHKRAQLRELAALNGTIRDDESCRNCGQLGHRQYCCPEKNSSFKSGVVCAKCGDGGHPTSDCRQQGAAANKMDGEYQKFLVEVNADGAGVGDSTVGRHSGGSTLLLGSGTNGTNNDTSTHNGTAGTGGKIKEPDDTNLYVGYLPPNYDDESLRNLFAAFGQIEEVKVIKDRNTGASKGYGFVKFSDAACAVQAVYHMNGCKVDDKTLAVRVAGRPPAPVAASTYGTDAAGFPIYPPPHGNSHPPGLAPPPPPGAWGPGPPAFAAYGTPTFPPMAPGTGPQPFNGYHHHAFAAPPPPGMDSFPMQAAAAPPPPPAPGTNFQQFTAYYPSPAPPPPAFPPWAASAATPVNNGQPKPNQVESEYERFMSEMQQ